MAPRANWKGILKVAEVICPVALFTAASTSERIAFHTLNRKTGNRVHRQFVDSETAKPVEAENQVKGYDKGNGDYIILEPDEIAAAIPESDKTLDIQAFIACSDLDDVYFDRPYYLAPSSSAASEAFALLRDGMRAKKVAALAQTVIFRRMRSFVLRAHGDGLIATTLNFNYEIRSADDAFSDIPTTKIDAEMLDLAKHIINTKKGKFDPKEFDDRYETALADLVKAKLEGRTISAPKLPAPTKVSSLMDALRQSAKRPPPSPKSERKRPSPQAPRRKAS